MAEYRNTDNVLMMFNRFYNMCETKEQKTLVLDMKQAFLEIKPEDVVPRSEVERLTIELEAMQGVSNSYKLHYEKAKQEVAEKIFAELDNEYGENNGAYRIDDLTYGDIRDFLAELKKKCIGEKKTIKTDIIDVASCYPGDALKLKRRSNGQEKIV